MVFERIGGFSEIVKKIAEQRAKELDEKIRASIEGSTITFFDVEFQKYDGGHLDYQTHTQTIVRIATDGKPVEEPLPSGATAKHITNRFKWKVHNLPWTDEDESTVFNYDWHKNKRWLEKSHFTTDSEEVIDIEDLGLTEKDVEDFGKAFLKNVDELAEIDKS